MRITWNTCLVADVTIWKVHVLHTSIVAPGVSEQVEDLLRNGALYKHSPYLVGLPRCLGGDAICLMDFCLAHHYLI